MVLYVYKLFQCQQNRTNDARGNIYRPSKRIPVLNITITNNVFNVLRPTGNRTTDKTQPLTRHMYILIVIACVASIKYQIKTPFYLSSEWSLAWAEIVVEVVDVVLNRGTDKLHTLINQYSLILL